MPRIKLHAQPTYRFNAPMNVRVTDINYGGHLGNGAVAGLLHQARVELLNSFGLSELDLGDGRTGLIQTDLAITYQGEAFMLDALEVKSEFTEVKRSTFRMCHAIERMGTTIVLAEIGFAGYDYSEHKMSSLPKEFRDAIAAQ